jgi:hypothetical protein
VNGSRLRCLRPAALLAIILSVGWFSPAASGVCNVPFIVGVDLARADTTVTAFFCRGFGQVFLANDTLIHSISIWRPGQPALDGQPRYLYITGTGSGDPDVRQLLLAAPPLVNVVGDGVHPVEYRWVFDPPFALPLQGKFFFDILANDFSAFGILAATTDPYPDGQGWETGPEFNCDRPGDGRTFVPHPDLVFQIQFCATGATPTRQGSWGRLKTTYH